MIQIFRKTIKGKRFQELKELKSGAWIDVSEATTEEIKMVADLAELDFEDVDDVMDDYEIPRIEKHEKSTVIFVRSPAPSNRLMETDVLMIVLTEKYLVTISTRKNPFIRNVLKNKKLPPTTEHGRFLGYLLLKITQAYTRKIKQLSDEAMYKKSDLMSVKSNDIVELTESEATLNQYLSALVPMRGVYEALLKGKHMVLRDEDNDLFEDLLNSVNQSVEVCSNRIGGIGALRDTYQIIFTNDLNKTIKFLTSFTILLTIPTIVASIYGMNVNLPMGNHPLAFWFLMVLVIFVSLILLAWFRKKKWF